MTISSSTNKSGPYTGNGSTTVFPRTFRVTDADHLKVYQTVSGVTTEVTSGITKDGIGNDSGNVTFDTAPASGVEILLVREIPLTQETDYSAQGRVSPEQVEADLDLQEMQMQDLQEQIDRSIKVPIGSDGGFEVPEPVEDRLIIGAAGGAGYALGPSLTEIEADKAAAASSAADAATSAGESAASAAAASGFASDASDSADDSAASAVASATSAGDAATLKAQMEAILDSFDDSYLGEFSTAPTTDNDGDPLTVGSLYFQSTGSEKGMKIWDGSAWMDAAAGLELAMRKANNLSDVADVATARANLELGSAALAAATAFATAAQGSKADSALQPSARQSGPTDTTLTKLLEVLSFGIGVTGNAPIISDLDDLTGVGSGFYQIVSPTTSNRPAGVDYASAFVWWRNAGNPHVLMLSNAGRLYYRGSSSGTYGAWQSGFSMSDLPSGLTDGDILYYSSGALQRLAIGSAGQVLGVNDAGTGLEYRAGSSGPTTLEDISITGSPTEFEFDIDQGYDCYELTAFSLQPSLSAALELYLSDDGGSTYRSGSGTYQVNGSSSTRVGLGTAHNAAMGWSGTIRFVKSPELFSWGEVMVSVQNTASSYIGNAYTFAATAAFDADRLKLVWASSRTFTAGRLLLRGINL